jgi:hypothetical protein
LPFGNLLFEASRTPIRSISISPSQSQEKKGRELEGLGWTLKNKIGPISHPSSQPKDEGQMLDPSLFSPRPTWLTPEGNGLLSFHYGEVGFFWKIDNWNLSLWIKRSDFEVQIETVSEAPKRADGVATHECKVFETEV